MNYAVRFELILCVLIVLFSVAPIAYAQDYGTGAFQEDEGVSLPAFPSTPSQAGQPAGTETGDVSVLVKTGYRPAVGAQVKLTCYGAYGSSIQITDSFGAALFHFVPVGQCQVITNYQQSSDSKQITVSKGEIKTAEFAFQAISINSSNTTSATQDSNRLSLLSFFLWAVGFLVLIFLAFVGYKLIRKTIKRAKKAELIAEQIQINPSASVQNQPAITETNTPKETKGELSERTKDILETLDDKERVVAKFLLETDQSCSQSKVFYGTGIKRTTLHRIVDSLAAKKILQVEKRGKARYVKLTDWFLGKENV